MTKPGKLHETRSSLLRRIRNPDSRTAWNSFFDRYWRLIYNVCRKSGMNDADAEDVIQDTMLTISKRISGFDYDKKLGSFKNWLLTIVRSRISDHYRKHYKDQHKQKVMTPGESSRETLPEPMIAPELEKIWDTEWQENLVGLALQQVKMKVSPRQYQLFHCYVVENWDVGRIRSHLQASRAQTYMAKYRVGSVFEQELKKLMDNEP